MHRKIMLLSHTITMRGSDVASLVEFQQVLRRRQGDGQQTLGNIILLSHTLTMRGLRGSDVASLVEFRPVV